MLHGDVTELFEASASFNKILSTAAQRRLLYFKPQGSTTNPADNIVDTTALQVSFSYLPSLTTSIQIIGIEEHSPCTVHPTTGNDYAQSSTELAVAVQPTILSQQIQSYLKVIVEKNNLTSSRNFEIPVKNFKAVTSSSPFQWFEKTVILSSCLIAQLPHTLVLLMLLLLPDHEGLWGARRSKLREAQPRATLLHVHHDGNGNNAQHTPRSDDFLVDCVKEFLLTDLLLSFFYKIKTIWFHREWIMKLMIENHLLAHEGGVLFPQLMGIQGACFFSGTTCTGSDPDVDEKFTSSDTILDLQKVLSLDDEVLSFASDKHPMNYNAWQYRRARLTMLLGCSHDCCLLKGTMSSIHRDLLQCNAEDVMCYLETHNGDSSACSFLLFLLYQCTSNEREEPHGAGNAVDSPYSPCTSKDEVPLFVFLWRRLLCFTQRELRRHADKGHEGMWYLRLGLIHYALSMNSKTPSLCYPLLSSWTVADELEWTSVYIEGFRDMMTTGVKSSWRNRGLLAPCSDLAQAWAESSGSTAWSSYLATRYGLHLLRWLQPPQVSEL
ncbi:unnamed protein product [Phytomonas sp. EM1]|nr:unnamed protein product [Phytomonas sp. EM1]|eukprot:CCW62624.1 unnamed protein product [Phytomonas sp. isolate EM1]